MTRRFLMVAAATVVIPTVSAGQAMGSAFYNDSESGKPNPASVHLSCGFACANTWAIKVGDNAARPGKGGHFLLYNVGDFTGQGNLACDLGTGHPAVQDRGWASLHYRGGYEWELYGDNQRQVSGSPFAIKFGDDNPDEAVMGCGSRG